MGRPECSTRNEGTAKFGDYQTWYRITGDLSADQAPLVVLHGGPGCVHDYLLPVAGPRGDRPAVIHYDQVGNGRSTHLPDKPPEFWTVQLFLDELASLVDTLGIANRYLVLGQSWVACSAPSTPRCAHQGCVAGDRRTRPRRWSCGAGCRGRAPGRPAARGWNDTLRAHEEAGTTDSEAYHEAMRVFYDRHVCRVVALAGRGGQDVRRIDEDRRCISRLNGPSEFHVVGSLRDWTIVDRLGLIDVPTLVISGEYDEAAPATVRPYAEGIADVRWEILENCSHLPQIEDPVRFNTLVGEFLDACDTSGGYGVSELASEPSNTASSPSLRGGEAAKYRACEVMRE